MNNRTNTKSEPVLEMIILLLVGTIFVFVFLNLNLVDKLENVKTSNEQLSKQLDLLNDDIKNITYSDDFLINDTFAISKEITKDELLTLTINAIKDHTKIRNIDFTFKDRVYKMYEFKDISDTLKETSFPEYNEFYDCDDFSIATISDTRKKLQGLTIAYIKIKQTDGTYHALNGFIDSDKDFWIYEPQDKYISRLEDLDFVEILKIEY